MEWFKFLPGFFSVLPSWNQTALVLTSLAFGGTLLISVINYARHLPSNETQITIPREPLRIIMNAENCWWHMGGMSGKPAMQISLDGYVTNIAKDQGIVILQARFIYKGGNTSKGFLLVQNPKGNDHGMYMIPKGTTLPFSGLLWVQPPAAEQGQPFTGSLEITDQFGGITKIGAINLRYR